MKRCTGCNKEIPETKLKKCGHCDGFFCPDCISHYNAVACCCDCVDDVKAEAAEAVEKLKSNDALYVSGYSKSSCPYCGRVNSTSIEKIPARAEGLRDRDFFGVVYCEAEDGGCGRRYTVKKRFIVVVQTEVVEIPSERKKGEKDV